MSKVSRQVLADATNYTWRLCVEAKKKLSRDLKVTGAMVDLLKGLEPEDHDRAKTAVFDLTPKGFDVYAPARIGQSEKELVALLDSHVTEQAEAVVALISSLPKLSSDLREKLGVTFDPRAGAALASFNSMAKSWKRGEAPETQFERLKRQLTSIEGKPLERLAEMHAARQKGRRVSRTWGSLAVVLTALVVAIIVAIVLHRLHMYQKLIEIFGPRLTPISAVVLGGVSAGLVVGLLGASIQAIVQKAKYHEIDERDVKRAFEGIDLELVQGITNAKIPAYLLTGKAMR